MKQALMNGAALRVALYLRVSKGEQNTANQRLALEEIAARRGWQIVEIFEDHGITGTVGRDKRPAFDKMLKAATRRQFDMLACWAVDRLGRSLKDLVGLLSDLQAAGVDLYLHQQSLDTSTPSGRAMFAMCGIFAEFERSMIVARVHAGLDRARAQGKKLGRKPISADIEQQIRQLRQQGKGMLAIAKEVGCGSGTVQRVCASH